ncbi:MULTISPECIES: sugar-binding transcriptional regulator [unclassified Halanaerobium]|uniref:sugar-binding transcriptional regulator n=1 Tax=unclassified Halanaerobium TaxID=2641197 RepID=UPI000DF4C798|nr:MULTISPECIES: sugar-binding transcriptional regulator [unclassified Halanaerobium]RCW47354.1 deoxyribonucleoside regulator [Halanaerobium sp. MA284_MarDTE_T2]RCW84893.1 deoxyribonucleoside regulator [Halanaerobium sp. DL-01]
MDENKRYCKKLKAARYYYNEGLTQQEIADRLYISRPTVSKMLKEAEEEGIVQFKIIDVKDKCHMLDLEDKLVKKFGLKNAVIAEYDEKYNDLKDRIGKAAAQYFEDVVKSGMTIAISWGTTLRSMVKNLNFNKSVDNLKVVSMVGGSRNLVTDIQANILVEKILNKYQGKGYYLYAPAVVDSPDIGENLKNNQETKEVLEKSKEANIAFVGIGPEIEKSTLKETGYFNQEEINLLMNHNSVGDICWRFFDKNGEVCIPEIDKRTIGVSLDTLKEMKTVAGVAGGEEKLDAILATLRGNLIDILITDEITARKIIEKSE